MALDQGTGGSQPIPRSAAAPSGRALRAADHTAPTAAATAVAAKLKHAAARAHSVLYDWLANGIIARYISGSLRRRILLSNLVGLLILLIGSMYISKHQAWLIDAKRESLEAQGHIVAAAIVSSARIEDRDLVIDPAKLQVAPKPAPGTAPVPTWRK